MKIILIIQSRMGSIRFPGKSFFPFKGKPVLVHLIDSVSQLFDKSSIYIATSENKENNPIVSYCNNNGLNVFEGDENNVASRFLHIVNKTECDFFVRINGDSPLIDYRTIASGLEILKEKKFEPDMVTTMSSNFPSGMNMEIMKSETFVTHYPFFDSPGHYQHVTTFFKEKQKQFNIIFLKCPLPDVLKFKFAFDTEDDRKRIEAIFNALELPHYEYTLEEKCAIYNSLM